MCGLLFEYDVRLSVKLYFTKSYMNIRTKNSRCIFASAVFLFSFSAGFEPIVHLLRSKGDIKLLQATRLALSDSATPAKNSRHNFVSAVFCLAFWQDSNRQSIFCEAKGTYKLLQATRLALSDPATPATSSQATYRLRRFFIASHSFRCSSSPKQITLKSPVRL